MVTGTLPGAVDYVNIPLATGFDYPVGKPDSKGYYKARGFGLMGTSVKTGTVEVAATPTLEIL